MTCLILSPGALRLALALIVVVAHYAYLSGTPLYVPIDGPAVVGFFFFSGYWVARLWCTKYSRCRAKFATFYASRAIRIYPLAILATLAMRAVAPVDTTTLLWNIALLGLQLGSALNPPAWSLATELQFYAVAPLLLVLVSNMTALLLLLLFGAGAWIAFAFGYVGTYLPTFILPFVLGVCYAQSPSRALAVRLAPLSLAAFVLLGVVPNIVPPAISLNPVSRFVVIVLSIVSLPYIAASLTITSSRFDRELGNVAYPVFLFHWPMFLLAAKLLPDYQIAVALALLTAICVVALWIVDQPLERWRHKWVASRIFDDGHNPSILSHRGQPHPDLIGRSSAASPE
jgi:peptidoglycan/LPS O-acetylase OafA/YrhL